MSRQTAVLEASPPVVSFPKKALVSKPTQWLYLFFFVSGFPALLYQIVWQRALFTLYGVNIESVTMVVTAFMVGLGLGSLLGGMVSRDPRVSPLRVFGFVELSISLYGTLSLKIFHWAAHFTAGAPPLETGLVAFALVAIPTLLMGATLPLLVSYAVRYSNNVGASVGSLYAVNTLGSAYACFCAGLFLMRSLGESRTVALAAGLNALLGTTVLVWHFTVKRGRSCASVDWQEVAGESEPELENLWTKSPSSGIGFVPALTAATVAGFVALGYEIVWYRLFSFATGGVAKSFAFLLGSYLLGVGAGAQIVGRLCRKARDPISFTRLLVGTVVMANVIAFMVAPFFFALVVRVSLYWILLPISLAAACLGAVFPLLCHISIPPDRLAGSRAAFLYLANIVGSALGSYLTGFVLMDWLPLKQVTVALALVGLGLGLGLLLRTRLEKRLFAAVAASIVFTALLLAKASAPLFDRMYDKMFAKTQYDQIASQIFSTVLENRNGVIGVSPHGGVYGGGVYDGHFSVDLVSDQNGIQRPYSLSYFHPNPKDVLMIGLSSGSWAEVIANHPQVEHLTIIEINPGYLQLIRQFPQVAPILKNPKVHIEIDDGRRWLVRNPARKFDSIVMNTTFHWRSNASNLLSVEFLQLIRLHLNPGGVEFYNTTDSPEAMLTGTRVFPYGMRLANFMVVSDSPLQLDADRWRSILTNYKMEGQPVFDLSEEKDRQRLEEILSMTATMDRAIPGFFTLESSPHIRARAVRVRIITDDNMGTEWTR
jgi:spermidine synthase